MGVTQQPTRLADGHDPSFGTSRGQKDPGILCMAKRQPSASVFPMT